MAVEKRIVPDEPTAVVAVKRDVQNGSGSGRRSRGLNGGGTAA